MEGKVGMYLGHNELCILRAVQHEFCGNISQGDTRIGEVDHANASLDDIMPESNDECVGALLLETPSIRFQDLVEDAQVAYPHSWKAHGNAVMMGWQEVTRIKIMKSHKPCVSWKYGWRVFFMEGWRKMDLSGMSPSRSSTAMVNFWTFVWEEPMEVENLIFPYSQSSMHGRQTTRAAMQKGTYYLLESNSCVLRGFPHGL